MKKLYISLLALAAVAFVSAQDAVRIDIIDANTDQVIKELVNGTVIALADAQNINLEGVYTGDVNGLRGQFKLRKNGVEVQARSEGVVPYAMFVDDNGDFRTWASFTAALPEVASYEIDFYLVAKNGDAEPAAGSKITRSFTVVETTSVKDSENRSSNIYYNGGSLNLKSFNSLFGTLQLYSPDGKLVFDRKIEGEGCISVALNKGMYIAKYSADGKVFTKKVLVK